MDSSCWAAPTSSLLAAVMARRRQQHDDTSNSTSTSSTTTSMRTISHQHELLLHQEEQQPQRQPPSLVGTGLVVPPFEEEEDEVCVGAELPFPIKLHHILNDCEKKELAHIVSWQPHGRCFVVHNPKEFVKVVLRSWCNMTKFASFQRQLNLYGFQRITSGRDKGGYYHECFLRGKPFLARSIRRIKIKGTGVRKPSSPETEPDFYRMPYVFLKNKEMIIGSSASTIFPGAGGRRTAETLLEASRITNSSGGPLQEPRWGTTPQAVVGQTLTALLPRQAAAGRLELLEEVLQAAPGFWSSTSTCATPADLLFAPSSREQQERPLCWTTAGGTRRSTTAAPIYVPAPSSSPSTRLVRGLLVDDGAQNEASSAPLLAESLLLRSCSPARHQPTSTTTTGAPTGGGLWLDSSPGRLLRGGTLLAGGRSSSKVNDHNEQNGAARRTTTRQEGGPQRIVLQEEEHQQRTHQQVLPRPWILY